MKDLLHTKAAILYVEFNIENQTKRPLRVLQGQRFERAEGKRRVQRVDEVWRKYSQLRRASVDFFDLRTLQSWWKTVIFLENPEPEVEKKTCGLRKTT